MLLSMMILKAAANPAPPLTSLTIEPDQSGLPGGTVIQNLTNGLGWWALVAAMVGVVVGAIVWAFGHYSQYRWRRSDDLQVWSVWAV